MGIPAGIFSGTDGRIPTTIPVDPCAIVGGQSRYLGPRGRRGPGVVGSPEAQEPSVNTDTIYGILNAHVEYIAVRWGKRKFYPPDAARESSPGTGDDGPCFSAIER